MSLEHLPVSGRKEVLIVIMKAFHEDTGTSCGQIKDNLGIKIIKASHELQQLAIGMCESIKKISRYKVINGGKGRALA